MATAGGLDTSPLSILCTLGMRGVLVELEAALAARGLPCRVHFEATQGILRRLAAGERADVAILLDATIEQLSRDGILLAGSRRDLARSGITIAVRAGAAKPDISTVEGLKRALLAAPSVAYTRSGASGIHFASVIDRLGIAEEVTRRAVIRDGLVGDLVARGEAALAVQQTSELLPVAGIEIVGPLPGELQKMSVFSAGIFAGSRRIDIARSLIEHLASADVETVIRSKGLEPASAFASPPRP